MAQEPNVHEIKNSILILKSNPMALQSAEVFLNTRGWDVYSATTLQETVKIVLTKNPEYLLLCANHPQKKVRQLPKILAQAVKIKIILYIDSASTANVSAMNTMGIPNYILPPVSGPAIERAVFKFEKNEAQKEADRKKAQHRESMGSYSVSRDEPPRDIELKLNELLNNPSDDEDDPLNWQGPAHNKNSRQSHDASENESFADWEERRRKERTAHLPQDSDYSIDLKNKGNLDKIKPVSYTNTGSDEIVPNQKKMDSIIVKGAQQALDASVKVTDPNTPIQKLEKSQNCLCIVIDSTRFSGYLIAAMGKNRRFDDDFIKNIHNKLYDFLKTQGEKLDDDGPLEIKIKTVEFEDWALEKAEFLKKSIHDGDEVAMAFFPSQKTAPQIAESVRDDMLTINIDDLEGDIQVNFDVYIYMPTNKKFILYTPKGGTFMGNQKDRLKGKGITHMHMKKDEVGEAKKYTAQNYLNEKITQYQQDKEANELKAQKEKKKA